MQVAELGIDPARDLTLTGGMTFGGGPLNNYTLQALVRMTHLARATPAATALVTNVSGMLTKFGASVWSCAPPTRPFAALAVTEAATAATPTTRLDPDYAGAAEVVTYTVAFDKGEPIQGIVVGETSDGTRVLATTTDVPTMQDMTETDWCARRFTVSGPDLLA